MHSIWLQSYNPLVNIIISSTSNRRNTLLEKQSLGRVTLKGHTTPWFFSPISRCWVIFLIFVVYFFVREMWITDKWCMSVRIYDLWPYIKGNMNSCLVVVTMRSLQKLTGLYILFLFASLFLYICSTGNQTQGLCMWGKSFIIELYLQLLPSFV